MHYRALFVIGLLLLLLSAGGTASLAARTVPRQTSGAILPVGALAAPDAPAAPEAVLPAAPSTSSPPVLWALALAVVAVSGALAASVLRPAAPGGARSSAPRWMRPTPLLAALLVGLAALAAFVVLGTAVNGLHTSGPLTALVPGTTDSPSTGGTASPEPTPPTPTAAPATVLPVPPTDTPAPPTAALPTVEPPTAEPPTAEVVTQIIQVTRILPTDEPPSMTEEPPTEEPPTATPQQLFTPTSSPAGVITPLPGTELPTEPPTATPSPARRATETPAAPADTATPAVVVDTVVITVILPTPVPTEVPGLAETATAAAEQSVQTAVAQPNSVTQTAVAAIFVATQASLAETATAAAPTEASAGGDEPSPTPEGSPTPERPYRTVIRADYPGRLEVGEPDRLTVRMVRDVLLPAQPTVAAGQTASVATAVPVGTPQVPLERAFGESYTACAEATLTAAGVRVTPDGPAGCVPLADVLEWTWRLEAERAGAVRAAVQIDVVWTSDADGDTIRRTVWAEDLPLPVEQPLIPSRPLGALSLASAGLGLALTAPLALRRAPTELRVERRDVPVTDRPPTPEPEDELLTALLGSDTGAEPRPPPHPHLNTEIKGLGSSGALTVGRRASLFVWVGEQQAVAVGGTSRPFAFDLAAEQEPVRFLVRVDADPECWLIEAAQPVMVATPGGTTDQAAVFRVTALRSGQDKLYLSVEREDTAVAVQHIWLPVVAEEAPRPGERATAALGALATRPIQAVRLPLDGAGMRRREVRITIASGRDAESFTAVVDAELPGERVHQIFPIPVSAAAVQNATLRLRQELERLVLFAVEDGGGTYYPFADPYSFSVEEGVARRALAPLADAGQQVWQLLFNAPRAPEGLRQLAAALRTLPDGSNFQVVIESQQFIVPWALLYDRAGDITPETVDPAGFWGYRYVLDVLPPGDYPEPTIGERPPSVRLMFNDDQELRRYAEAQEREVRGGMGMARVAAAWGAVDVRRALAQAGDSTLLYAFCHGFHASAAEQAGALPSESALMFSRGDRVRLADMRRLVTQRMGGRPLVFLNACEGATQDAFYYDGFMPFFIEECGARGFIGTEVKAPRLIAHDVALHFLRMFAEGVPVGEALWRLRRHYLDVHHNPLAFNYTLYGLDELQLAVS